MLATKQGVRRKQERSKRRALNKRFCSSKYHMKKLVSIDLCYFSSPAT